jgi:integrase
MGVPLYVIQQRVGHGDSRITRRIYLHITKKVKKDLANKLQNFSIENNINNSNVTNINQYKKISH